MPTKPPVLNGRAASVSSDTARRGSASSRGYDRAWQKVRLIVLHREPLCRFCITQGRVTAAEEVDHIETIESRPDLRLVLSNLRPLCKSCHSSRTAKGQRHASGA